MKNLFLALCVFGLFQVSWTKSQNIEELKNNSFQKGNEFKIRNGLPNFFSKAIKGDSIKVAYLGGSITAQNGWRIYSLDWFRQRFPKSKFTEINAAIGGTGSDLGVFRIHEHVLKFNPDLVFIEFAVNDDGTPDERIIRSMEGIVRQTWQYNPQIDICFVYTIKQSYLPTEHEGKLPASIIDMEKVADKYKIPTINFGFEVASQVNGGKLIFTNKESKEVNGIPVFCPDGVHPYIETGHLIYKTVLSRSLETMQGHGKKKPTKHKFLEPINSGYFSDTKMLAFTVGKLSANWEIITAKEDERFKSFGGFLDNIGRACSSGETLTVHFKGKAVGLFDVMGPDAGKVAVEIDGVPGDTITRFDRFCTYRRMHFIVIDKLEDTEHTVIFKTIATAFDKQSILTRKEDFEQHPEKYNENCWHIGKILLDGELLK